MLHVVFVRLKFGLPLVQFSFFKSLAMALIIRSVHHLLVISLISFVVLQQKSDAQEVLMLQKPRLINCKFDKIYQLGDSLSDTGNCIRERICGAHTLCARFPYGMNFFQNATGRCSNGMLMIDFIALESGFPLLNPIKDQTADFRHGADFAVAGATALPVEILENMKMVNPSTNSSLSVQLDWMSSHFENTFNTDWPDKVKKALFLVGGIGGNEFNFALSQGKTLEESRTIVPEIVEAIIHGVRRVISFGATRIVVPGNFPGGCFPIILTRFMTDNSSAYDELHCLKDFNSLIIFFNDHLQQAILDLKKEYPNITLIYGDYYNAYLWLLQNAVSLGFDKNSLHKACCGIGGDYNYNLHNPCGTIGVPVCIDPSTYISWDGAHLTQEAYSWLARWLIDNNILPQLNCQA